MEKNNKQNQPTEAEFMQSLHKEICTNLHDTYKRKNADYGNSFSRLFRKRGWAYAMGHIEEKMERIDMLTRKDPSVVGEGIQDSLLDLANYAILTLMEVKFSEKTVPNGKEEETAKGEVEDLDKGSDGESQGSMRHKLSKEDDLSKAR